jgi:hypothetical protein
MSDGGSDTINCVMDITGFASLNPSQLVICPTGIFVSSLLCKNISLHPSGKSSLQIRAIPSHKRGVVTKRGVGCGGRDSVLHATGLQGGFFESVSDQRARGREMLLAYGEVVWS